MRNRYLVLLSGEGSSIPEAEAKALFLTYDPKSRFEVPERRVLLAESGADPSAVARRIAFARRVGVLLRDPSDASDLVDGKTARLRTFDLGERPSLDPATFLGGFEAKVDLRNPDFELTLVRGDHDYLALTVPREMRQGWSLRRPRARPFFHPSAIFPKLARALVNMSRCREGDVFLDPYCGTGSLPLEAAIVGAKVVAFDRADAMTKGARANMERFGQSWLGIVRCEALRPPATLVDSVATDIPYGRASSTMGAGGGEVLRGALATLPSLVRSGSRLVIMHSKDDRAEGTTDLTVEEEHDLQVHKKLTRTITVLRRR